MRLIFTRPGAKRALRMISRSLHTMMEKSLDFSRQYSNFFPGYAHILDPIIDLEDEGMTVASIKSLFTELRGQLVPLVQKDHCMPHRR